MPILLGAIADDGDFAMHCQSCHGGMSDVGDPNRVGWLEQPTCQQCHTGHATQNSGEIRFTSVFDQNGNPHVAANDIFAKASMVGNHCRYLCTIRYHWNPPR